jgi:membrane fusion protein, copper/silver efflux system
VLDVAPKQARRVMKIKALLSTLRLGLLAPSLLLSLFFGCDRSVFSRAAADTPSSAPTSDMPLLVHQGGQEWMTVDLARIEGLSIGNVEVVTLPGILEAVGQVSFDDRLVSTIISRVTGRLEDIKVSQWDTVRAGENILSLYSPDFMTAEAEYLEASSGPRITGPLIEGGAYDTGADLKEAAIQKLELLGLTPADIANIRQATPSRWMRAPISGIVVSKLALRGAQVNPGDQLFSLASLRRVWITADIYEDDLSRVHTGQNLEAVTVAYPGETFKGVVDRISPALDPNVHTLQLLCSIENPGEKLRPQMLARVRIVTRPGSALVVPQTALVFEANTYYAFVQTGADTVERRKVQIATWNDHGYARVVSGLKAGERVVTRKSLQLDAVWRAAHGLSS